MPTGIYKHKPHSKETKKKLSLAKIGNPLSKEHIKNLSISHKGYKQPEETRKKISESHKGKIGYWRGKIKGPHSEKIKTKISNTLKGHIVTEETKRKMSENRKGKQAWNKGKHTSEETRKKQRISAINYIKNIYGNICPRIGKNEKKILDKLEKELGYKIIRQHQVCGYFTDGYIPELNLVIEIDERPKTRDKDTERERIIKKELNCKFMRINDYD